MRRMIVLGLALAVSVACSGAPSTPPASDEATIERVVDGDTLVARVGGARVRVRLIGVDTPETVKPGAPIACFGPQASAFAKKELTGARVRLRYDRERTDRFGRTLAYVYIGESLFNLTLVEQGYATALNIRPNDAHANEFARAERAARRARQGLWGACGARD